MDSISKQLEVAEEFHSIFEVSSDLICVADLNTANFTKVNPSFTCILGYTEEELLERSFLEFIHPEDVQPTVDVIENNLKRGKKVSEFENRYRTKSDEYRWFSWTAHPNVADGLIYAIARDVTDSKHTALLLAGEKRILEIIATSNSQDGGLTELVNFIESLSDGMICSILLLDNDGVHLRHGASVSLPEEYNQAVDGLKIGPNKGSCGTAACLNQTVIVSDIASDPLWTNYRDLALKHNLRACWSIPIQASTGKVLGTFAMYYDQPRQPDNYHKNLIERAVHLASIAISKRNAEAEIRESEIRYRTLLEGSPICTKIVTLDSKLQYMSNAGQKALKISCIDHYYGNDFPPDLYPEPWRSRTADHLDRAKRGEVSSIECLVHDTEGQEFWFDTNFVPVRDSQGHIKHVIVTSVNITDRKHAEEEIRRQQDKLAHISRLSTMGEMATGLAHEVNQPLAAISNYCLAGKRLLENVDAIEIETLRDLLQKLSNQSLRAGEIIRRLKGFVGKRAPVRVSADIRDSIREVIRLFESDLRRSGIRIKNLTKSDMPPVVIDDVQIQQVLVNLIRNAIEAMAETPRKQRSLAVATALSGDDFIEVTICDNGKGLPKDSIEQVFEAFFTSKPDGMGMGLAISRSIIQSHGGTMWATPQEGQGVTFHFTLPIDQESGSDD